jgi:Ser/Thr protein kinase RdoA (MazF antagonist)
VSYQDWIASYVEPAGPLEVIKERPWSFVVKVPAKDGVFWFKENRGATGYEASLIHALARWVPGRVLQPVAIDAERSWSLLPDGGQTLRETGGGNWEQMLAEHAQLQRDLAVHSAQLLSLRVPDQSPAAMAAWASARGATPPPLPTLADIPLTLQHDDLHDGNVFADGKVFDWGDASVSHPFGVLLVSLNVLAHFRELKPGDPLLKRAAEAYLEPWSDLAPRASLLAEARKAIELAKIGRAMSWERGMRGATAAQITELGSDPVQGWLGELGEPNTV